MTPDDPLDIADFSSRAKRTASNFEIAIAITALATEMRHFRDDARELREEVRGKIGALETRFGGIEATTMQLKITALTPEQHAYVERAAREAREAQEVHTARLGSKPAHLIAAAGLLVAMISSPVAILLIAHLHWI